jgi:hypothetical protein
VAYATAAELAASDFLPTGISAPTGGDAARLLSRASRIVDTLLLRAVYDVDDDGMPTDTGVVTAVRDATCAQACWWLETGDEAGVASGLNSISVGSGPSISGSLSRVAPDAVEVLRTAVDSVGNPIMTGPWQP